MERIVENHQDYFFDIEKANKYLNDAKNASNARYSHFLSSLKKLDIKGKYLKIGDACKINSIKELGKFDLIYSTFTLHHWDDAELKRIGIENYIIKHFFRFLCNPF